LEAGSDDSRFFNCEAFFTVFSEKFQLFYGFFLKFVSFFFN